VNGLFIAGLAGDCSPAIPAVKSINSSIPSTIVHLFVISFLVKEALFMTRLKLVYHL
jgi:hypothetical protein